MATAFEIGDEIKGKVPVLLSQLILGEFDIVSANQYFKGYITLGADYIPACTPPSCLFRF